MAYALVVVDKPARQPWPDGLDFYSRTPAKRDSLIRVAENSWLIHIDTDLLALSNIVRLAYDARFPLRAIFFDQKPDLVSLAPNQAGD